ncbi:MAG: DUF5685 family protein [Clostridia bacterium]|nr:DUF5685 family protein [Clostridia bacterium]
MFGYITIDKSKLNDNEIGLHQTFLCGICLSTKHIFGNLSRNLVNYDINFLNLLFHSYEQATVSIKQDRCVSSPFVRRSLLNTDRITDQLAVANVILAYTNVLDDCIDGAGIKKQVLLRSLNKPYSKATQLNPQLSLIVNQLYEQLREKENKCDSNIDSVCDCFAQLSQQVAGIIMPKCSEHLYNLCYNVGKWVYLIDALDDLQSDYYHKRFNPLIAHFSNFINRQQFITDNKEQLIFLFYTTLNSIALCYNELNLTQYTCVLNNIIYHSIRDKTESLLNTGDVDKRTQLAGKKG